MTQPAETQRVQYVRRDPWTANRLLLFVAFVCFLLAALITAFKLDIGPALAWGWGGFASWLLAQVL